MTATGWGIKEGISRRRLEDKPPYLPLGIRKGIWKVGRAVLSALGNHAAVWGQTAISLPFLGIRKSSGIECVIRSFGPV